MVLLKQGGKNNMHLNMYIFKYRERGGRVSGIEIGFLKRSMKLIHLNQTDQIN